MDREVTEALCALTHVFINKLQKLDEEMKQLLFLCELEESSLKYYEQTVGCLLMQAFTENTDEPMSLADVFDYFDKHPRTLTSLKEWGLSISPVKDKEPKKTNMYIPKYEWTEERTQRLLESVERHYPNLIKNKDFAKPVWDFVRLEVDCSDPHLKWYTCRHKWSHLESDYKNYLKDLQDYSGRNVGDELTLYVPHYYERIGTILRNSCSGSSSGSSEILQKMLEDRIGEVLRSTSRKELCQRDDEDLITISSIGVNLNTN